LKKGLLCCLVCAILAFTGIAQTEDVRTREMPPLTPNPYQRSFIDYETSMSFAPMDTATPDFPPFHNNQLYRAGVTYYDLQHNTTKGRNIVVDPQGGVHVAWMNGLDETFSNRRIYYNYMAPGGTGFECADSTGVRVDNRTYAGYCNISVDDSTTVPTVAYHDRGGSPSYGTNISYDGTYYATSGDSRCGFISPAEIPMPWALSELDLQAIWPKIAQIDTTIFMVSTPSTSDTTIGGIYYGQSVVYYRGFISPAWGGFTEATFEPPVALDDDQNGITCDVSAWSDGTDSRVAIAWVGRDSVTMEDTCLCDDETMWANSLDPAYLALRTSTDMGETWSPIQAITEAGVHIYSDYPDTIYLGYELDTMVSPPETTHIYRPVYTRPLDVNITFDDEGDIHLVWSSYVVSPNEEWEDNCFGSCSVSVWCRSIVYHWEEGSSSMDTVFIDPFGWCNEYSRYVGDCIYPQVAIDEDENVYVCWEQFYSEMLWDFDESDTLFFYDMSDEGIENAEIFCSMLPAGSSEWGDPINISNTYTTGCTEGECWCELNVTLAERIIDDKLHMSFIRDTYAGLSDRLDATGTGTGYSTTTLNDVYYVGIPLTVFDPDNVPEVDFNGVTMPETFRLGRNFPNPFNAATGFWFDVYEPGHFTVDVVDVLGRTVSRVLDKELKDGRHHFVWDGYADNGWIVPSGTYFLRATDSNGSQFSRKITLIK